MRILFIDTASPAAYDSSTPEDPCSKVGGAELSVIRVASGLASSHDVVVAQAAMRAEPRRASNVLWISSRDSASYVRGADVVVVVRRIADAWRVRRLNRACRILLWYHDWYASSSDQAGIAHRSRNIATASARILLHITTRAEAVVVSRTHAKNLEDHLRDAAGARYVIDRVRVNIISNPTEARTVGANRVDSDKMIYFSAPWKGISQVLEAFAYVRASLPSMTLYVASPGYNADLLLDHVEGIVHLGHLTSSELAVHVESSLCVFYPASLVPETFGLVFTESHALGTPVLAHRFGAALELLTLEELVDATSMEEVLAKVRSWREGRRPVVTLGHDLTTPAVLAQWEKTLLG